MGHSSAEKKKEKALAGLCRKERKLRDWWDETFTRRKSETTTPLAQLLGVGADTIGGGGNRFGYVAPAQTPCPFTLTPEELGLAQFHSASPK